VLLIGQLIRAPSFSAALALLVISRRTRTQSCRMKQQKFVYRGTPRQVVGVLVRSIEFVDGRPRVLHRRWSRASWLNTQSLSYAGGAALANLTLNTDVWIAGHKIVQRPLRDRKKRKIFYL